MPDRVLIIDDEETTTLSLARFLRTRGYQCDCAQELEEALALLSNQSYQAVVTDMRLTAVHGAEGLEVISFVRDRCPGTKVLLLTSHGSDELEEEVLSRGGVTLLRKPIGLPELEATLSKAVSQA